MLFKPVVVFLIHVIEMIEIDNNKLSRILSFKLLF